MIHKYKILNNLNLSYKNKFLKNKVIIVLGMFNKAKKLYNLSFNYIKQGYKVIQKEVLKK